MTDPVPDGAPARGAGPDDRVAPEHRIADAADDWPVQATDAIVGLVDTVRDRTTGPALAAARAVVLGVVVAAFVTVIGVLALIGSVRAGNELLDWAGLSRETAVWVTDAAIGGLLLLVGLLLWRRRRAPAAA